MVKFILWGLIALSLTIGIIQSQALLGSEQETQKEVLLQKPRHDWIRCTSADNDMGIGMGLSSDDFIRHQMYMQGLEHNQRIHNQ